ncbi:MAG: SDR family oxidoreductase [Rhodobiaceae bacterium]|nr:SDR family oxidoreductase [Rhodobiaceae bacterium]MCC0056260.1 SDR family oxidoreductase [Rhodobiaceae bacterium]
MTFDPTGQIAVVTGAGSGIGKAFAHALASRASAVFLADIDGAAVRSVAETLKAQVGHGNRPVVIEARALDVADPAAVAALAAEIEETAGPIDLWVSNAGIHRGLGLGEPDDWRVSLDVNVLGHVNSAAAAIPSMRRRNRGCFVIMASAAGLLSDLRSAPYTAAKHAAVALAEWIAIDLGGTGASVVCVCPEGVRTQMTRPDSASSAAAMDFIEPEQVVASTFEAIAAGRFLALPHARVAEFEIRRATDRERWLASMKRAKQRMGQTAA